MVLSLLKMVHDVKRQLNKFSANRILVAVSGGVDSMVLLQTIEEICDKSDFAVINVDHDLREQSKFDTDFVQKYCKDKGITFYSSIWNHQGDISKGMEVQAREYRYNYFYNVMSTENFDTLLTAHHQNDIAENILMKMIRSGNLYEISSLKVRRPFKEFQIVRPLLNFSKQDIKEIADQEEIDFVEDETNSEDITIRNRIRNSVLPLFEEENGQYLEHFELFDKQLKGLLQLGNRYFDQLEQKMNVQVSSDDISGLVSPVFDLNDEQSSLFWGRFFTKNLTAIKVSNRQIEMITSIIKSDRPNLKVDLDKGHVFLKSYDKFSINVQSKKKNQFTKNISINEMVKIDNKKILIESCPEEDADFSTDNSDPLIELRNRIDGDLLLIQDGHHQKLSRRLIDKKVPKERRDKLLVLSINNQVVWVEKNYRLRDYLNNGNYFWKVKFEEDSYE
ncbi:tRNA lysidine(34) synthetase TilS [Lactobacillus terrae]|uniref:tRNA lysidine(34) synthetase TilS n=1 Tax=Lactobacillus terrae TaxID=2269374 RepID=UPI000C1B6967|nr:tRNA lysidine(34) synthetase TilS [Lactobacillus terrae]